MFWAGLWHWIFISSARRSYSYLHLLLIQYPHPFQIKRAMPRRKGVFLKSSIAPTLIQNNVHSLPVPEPREWNYLVKYYLAIFSSRLRQMFFSKKIRKGRGAIPPLLPPWQKKTRQIVLSSVKLTPSLSNRLLGGQLGTPDDYWRSIPLRCGQY